jgi:hypothetical protein
MRQVLGIPVPDGGRRATNKSEKAGAVMPGANEAQLSKLVEMVMGHGYLRPASTPTDDLKLEEEFRRSCVVDDPDGARAGASWPQPRQNTAPSCS